MFGLILKKRNNQFNWLLSNLVKFINDENSTMKAKSDGKSQFPSSSTRRLYNLFVSNMFNAIIHF